jgi:hypothetical protein
MDLPLPPNHWSIERLTEDRIAAVGARSVRLIRGR